MSFTAIGTAAATSHAEIPIIAFDRLPAAFARLRAVDSAVLIWASVDVVDAGECQPRHKQRSEIIHYVQGAGR
jgi:hypothetical protein